MKRKNIFILTTVALAVAAVVVWVILHYIERPAWIQGRIECTTYRATSRMAGRIEYLPVREGQHVEKGELLYTLSTPELDMQILLAEQARNVALAIDCALDVDARYELERAALAQWQEAQAGEELGRKNYERIEHLCRKGIVPEAKRDRALAALKHLGSIAESAHIHYKLVSDGSPNAPPQSPPTANPSSIWKPTCRMPPSIRPLRVRWHR